MALLRPVTTHWSRMEESCGATAGEAERVHALWLRVVYSATGERYTLAIP